MTGASATTSRKPRAATAAPRKDEATGTWWFIVDVGINPTTGKRRRAHRRGFRTKDEAKKALHAELEKARTGTYVDRSTLTVKQYLETWLEGIDVRENTRASYRRTLEQRVMPRIGSRRLQKLTQSEVTKMFVELRKSGSVKGDPLSPRSVAYTRTILAAALADALDDRLVEVNVARQTRKDRKAVKKSAPTKRRDYVVWTPTEVNQFLAAFRDDDARWYALFRILAMCGVRRSEALGLRWTDVHLSEARLAVRQSLTVENGTVTIAEPKTERGRRTIDLDPATVAALRAWKREQAAERLRIGPGWPTEHGALIFTRPDGRCIYPNAVGKVFDAAVATNSLRKCRLHDLRHTHASQMLSAGAHPALVSERLGHSSAGFTLSTYAHALKGQQAEVAANVAALIDGAAG